MDQSLLDRQQLLFDRRHFRNELRKDESVSAPQSSLPRADG
jgi:hypothetical protein